MQNYCLEYAKQVEITKTKIAYLLIAANICLLFSLYRTLCIFLILLVFLYRSFSQAPFLF